MANNIKTIRQFIESLKEKVVDKWFKVYRTRVEWVDALPAEEIIWHKDAPSDYRGYRNMEQECHIRRINEFVAIEEVTYNNGPSGYEFYTSVLYVRKDIWKNFHLNNT